MNTEWTVPQKRLITAICTVIGLLIFVPSSVYFGPLLFPDGFGQFMDDNAVRRDQERADRERQSSATGQVIDSRSADRLLSGCCAAAGGVWRSGSATCAIRNIGANPQAFISCCGSGVIRWDDGREQPMNCSGRAL